MDWLKHLIGIEVYPWVAGLSIGLAAGLWLDRALGRLDRRYPLTKHDKALALSDDVNKIAEKIRIALVNPKIHPWHYESLIAQASVVIGRLVDSAGFPKFERPSDPDRLLSHMYRYLFWVAPCLKSGDIRRAYHAAELANSVNSQSLENLRSVIPIANKTGCDSIT